MILNLTAVPTTLEQSFFLNALTENDLVLLTDAALMLAFQPNPYQAQGYLLVEDSHQFGEQPQSDWQLLSQQQWVEKLTEHKKQVTW